MTTKVASSKWLFILFPAISMMLGWGLRGHIGGGPFGAMIPGAMVALSIAMLLDLSPSATAVLMVFGVAGVGLGGEMTYGQTLGFLKNPETVWCGTAGTTLKGAVWGLLGGTVLSLGFIYRRISKRTIIYTFLILILGFFVGFKLINEPMVLYFSDPVKPRSESWAGLLFGGIFILTFLKFKLDGASFRLVLRFALWGMLGGGLGFGLGGFWMVLGSHLPNAVFTSWWKAMEFTFGFLFGSFLGYSSWKNRVYLKEFAGNDETQESHSGEKSINEFIVVLVVGLLIYWFISLLLNSIGNLSDASENTWLSGIFGAAALLENYAFAGLIMVAAVLYFPKSAWQIGITLTFCHAAIDLVRDFFPDTEKTSPFTIYFVIVFVMTAVVVLLTFYLSRKPNSIRNLFLLVIWSCIVVSFARLSVHPEKLDVSGLSLCQIVCGRFIVDIFFAVSAVVVSWIIVKVMPGRVEKSVEVL